MRDITADPETLMVQATCAASEYLEAAITAIDGAFETPGFARQNPQLIGVFMQVATQNFQGALRAQTQQALNKAVAELNTTLISCAKLRNSW